MAIVKTTKNFQVESFVDQNGVSFLIRRKSNKKIVAKMPYKNNKQIKQDVNNRLKELELANEITKEQIRKAKKFSKDTFSFLKKTYKTAKKVKKELSKKPRKKRRKWLWVRLKKWKQLS